MNSRNKKPYLFALQVIVMALLLPTSLTPAAHGNDDDDDRRDFGRRIAGAYLADFNPTGRGLLNLFADGNVVAQETNDFGEGIPPAFQSGTRGEWRRIGRRKIEYTILEFNYGGDGTYISTAVIHVTAKFNRRFNRLNLRGSFEVFDAAQDPLDPTEVPFLVAEVAPFTARRIPVGR